MYKRGGEGKMLSPPEFLSKMFFYSTSFIILQQFSIILNIIYLLQEAKTHLIPAKHFR